MLGDSAFRLTVPYMQKMQYLDKQCLICHLISGILSATDTVLKQGLYAI